MKLDWQNITDSRSLDTPDIDPLLRHGNQRMNPALDGFKSLRQGRGLPIRRHHEKGTQPLQKHRDHRRLHMVRHVVEDIDLLDNRIELGRRHEFHLPSCAQFFKRTAHDRDLATDFAKELIVETVELRQYLPNGGHIEIAGFPLRQWVILRLLRNSPLSPPGLPAHRFFMRYGICIKRVPARCSRRAMSWRQ